MTGIWNFALVVVTYSSLHCTDGPVRSFLQLVALEDPLVSCIVIARIWHLQKPWCPRQRKNGSKGYKDKKQKFSVESYYSMTGNVWHQREAPPKNVFLLHISLHFPDILSTDKWLPKTFTKNRNPRPSPPYLGVRLRKNFFFSGVSLKATSWNWPRT